MGKSQPSRHYRSPKAERVRLTRQQLAQIWGQDHPRLKFLPPLAFGTKRLVQLPSTSSFWAAAAVVDQVEEIKQHYFQNLVAVAVAVVDI
jgi:hypothetical protein